MRKLFFIYFISFFSIAEPNNINFDFNKIPTTDALQLLADYKKQNLVLSNNVTGNITLKLKDVTWSQAFDYVITVAHLDVIFDGDTILVSSLNEDSTFNNLSKNIKNDIPKFTPSIFKINHILPSVLASSFHLLDDEVLIPSDDLSIITAYLPNERVDYLNSFINKLDYERSQILIEAKIVEINRDYLDSFGVDWGLSSSPTNHSFINGSSLISSAASNSFGLGFISSSFSLDAKLSLMESSGNGHVVSNPKVFVFDRMAASISKGVEIAYQEIQSDGVVTTSFKNASLSLDVLPKVNNDSIMLDIKLTKDEPDFSKAISGQPPISTSFFSSSLRLRSGTTAALGGVFMDNSSTSDSSVPFLSSIPLIGGLFKSKSDRAYNSELLLFITATLVQPDALPDYSAWFTEFNPSAPLDLENLKIKYDF